ncbi:fusaric acid resistance family protein [Aliiruegeria haliotis]|uniref:Fusaric acid resistance family protein n=1 Tax=Aliiruegeria haliotis TaxID=1280846 RepID=A0A2T0RLV7_9RHOB|nr:FUSC family protein [Aliiruegeria haliotis]PRY22158.1 fusaric acid resistance family protein [Aliiruegeria haliotis]
MGSVFNQAVEKFRWHHEGSEAIRLGVQGAVAAATSLILMRSLALPEEFLAVLSAVFILSTNTDESVGAGMHRIAATLVGSLIGLLCLWLLPRHWGTVSALATTVFLLNAISVVRPSWQYGTVAAIALSLGHPENVVDVSIDRGVAILIGVGVGIAVSILVWPDRAKARFVRHRRAALAALSERLAQVLKASSSNCNTVAAEADRRYRQEFDRAATAAEEMRLGSIAGANDQIQHLRRVYNSIVIIDRAVEEGWTADEGTRQKMEGICDALLKLADGEHAELPVSPDLGQVEEADDPEAIHNAVLDFGLAELVTESRKLTEAIT